MAIHLANLGVCYVLIEVMNVMSSGGGGGGLPVIEATWEILCL